ncbi:hypothetical protein LCH21_04325 [Patescibacteria group bacterium]|nr:hypothetical protein [Patescibacteria group bacterium]
MNRIKRLLFQDNTGKYIVVQPPNLPVYIMLVGIIGSNLFVNGKAHTFFDLLFFGAAFLWAYLEIRFGEAGVRRIMGTIVMIGLFVSRLA